MHYVYILYSAKSDKYYVGQTPDLENRLKWHNELGTGYTSKHRPWEIVSSYQVSDRGIAMKIESHIKKKKSRRFIEKLIQNPQLWKYLEESCSAG